MNVIVVTKNNIISSSGNNIFQYDFERSVFLKNKEIALASLSIYYSWYNISSSLGNNTFTYVWTVGTTDTTYTVTIPDGLWEISDINEYLQNEFITNGQYLINGDGDYVYYAELLINTNTYSVDIITYPVPKSLPTGYSEPTSWVGYPDDYFNPTITLTADFNEIVGYTAGYATDPNTGNNTILTYNSSTSPDIQPNEVILLTCSGVQNKYSNPYGTLYAITASVNPGDIISEKPPALIFSPLIDGTYSNIIFRLLKATDKTPIDIEDPNITLVFVIKDKSTPDI